MRMSWYKDLGKSTNLQQNREISDIRIDYNISDWCMVDIPSLRSEIEAQLITREVLPETYILLVVMAAEAQARPFLQFQASCWGGPL
jgi:hypothetical protein